MKAITKSGAAGTQKVVYDQVDSTFVGGVHVDPKTNFSTPGIIPAGTPIKRTTAGEEYEIEQTNFDDPDIIGLTQEDLKIDDYVLANIVVAGTCRIQALEATTKAGVSDLKKVLPRISFY